MTGQDMASGSGTAGNWRIRRVDVTGSTNDDIRAAAEAGELHGLVIRALRQTAGRGRYGRSWDSPEGNLYCSLLLRPGEGVPENAGCYSLMAGLAVCEAVQERLPPGLRAELKWPNDVLVSGRGKVAGVLLEAGQDWLAIGIGVNVGYAPRDAPYPVTQLRAAGMEEEKGEDVLETLLQSLLARVTIWMNIIEDHGVGPVLKAWEARAKQGAMSVRLPHETIQGSFAGLGLDGRLLLRLADGTERAIATGDVLFPSTLA